MKRAKKTAITLAKIAVSAALISYLVWDAVRRGEGVFSDEQGFSPARFFAVLQHAADHWYLLLAGMAAVFTAVMITFIRWYMLVRAIGLEFQRREAIRLGFVAYLVNLAPMGIVGGDLLKAVLLARERPGHRPEAVTTVFVDRILGFYTLFLLATATILATGFLNTGGSAVQTICYAVFTVAGAGTLGLLIAWLPDVTGGRSVRLVARVPVVGKIAARLVEAFRQYGKRPGTILVAIGMTLAVHTLTATSFFLIASALFDVVHSWQRHLVIGPVSVAAQALPVSIGPVEFVLDRVYTMVPLPGGGTIPAGQGLVVVLTYRIVCLLIATSGVGFYLAGRGEVAEAMHELEDETDALEPGGATDERLQTARSASAAGGDVDR